MKPSRFTDAQISHALRKVREGASAVEVCRTMGITQTTFYRWRKREDEQGAEPNDMSALRHENEDLKQIIANLLLEKKRTGEGARKK